MQRTPASSSRRRADSSRNRAAPTTSFSRARATATGSATWPVTPVELAAGGTVLVGPGWAGDDSYWLSGDGGRSGKLRKLPETASAGVAALVFDSPTQGMAVEGGGSCSQPATVLATDDAGATWQVEGSLGVTVSGLAVGPSLAVVTGWSCGGNVIAISTDLGKTWSDETTGNPCGPVSVYALTVAMFCANLMPGGQYVLLSRDGVHRWVTAGSNPPSAGYSSVGSVVVTGASSLGERSPRSAVAELRWRRPLGSRTAVAPFGPLTQ